MAQALYIVMALLLFCESLHAFSVGFLVAMAHAEGASAEGGMGELLTRVTSFGLLGGLLLTASVAAAVEQLGVRAWIRGLAPLFLAYGVWGLWSGFPPHLRYAQLPTSGGVATTIGSLGLLGIGIAGCVLGLLERGNADIASGGP